jgi:hypothetical protein
MVCGIEVVSRTVWLCLLVKLVEAFRKNLINDSPYSGHFVETQSFASD